MTDANNNNIINTTNPPSSEESKETPIQSIETQIQIEPSIPDKTEMCQLIYYDFSLK